jgi:methyl-accepting chemotaxis protein
MKATSVEPSPPVMHAGHDLQTLQQAASKGLLILLWLHLPLLAAIAIAVGHPMLFTELFAMGLAGSATAIWWFSHNGRDTRLTIAVAFIGMVALVVDQLSGHPWQLDSHMYFFAALAVLAAYCDWRVLLIAAAAAALHHLVLNFLLPAAIYPGGADFGRVCIHALILVLETAVLIWLTHQLATLFTLSSAALAAAETARTAEAAAYVRQAEAQTQSEIAVRAAQTILSRRFEADVGALVLDVASAVATVHGNAETLSATAQEASIRTATIVAASTQAAMNVQTVAAATEELSASVSEITSQIARAAQIAHRAVAQTEETSDTVKRVADLAGRIETVVHLINGIAGQTNLLALNATIEAARAAEAGKGFAVVATEVKALATQTAQATQEIRTQIAAIQDESTRAVSAIGGIMQVIADLGSITVAVAAAVEQQSAATAEIARSAQQAAIGTEAISNNLSALALAAEQTGAAAEAGRSASGHLSDHCEKMTGSVRSFVGTLQAA